MSLETQIAKLIHEEGLDNLEGLLTPREWDEVPFVSRIAKLAFIKDRDAIEQSRILVVNAVMHLDVILAYARATQRLDAIVMVSMVNWEDLESEIPEPIVPNFWICTDANRDLSTFRLRVGVSARASLVVGWLQSAGLLTGHEVLESTILPSDPLLQRVYIAPRGNLQLERFIDR